MTLSRALLAFVRVFLEESRPHQIAVGIVLGMCLALTPMLCLHWFAFVVALAIFRINCLAVITSWAAFQIPALLLEPVFHAIGMKTLTEFETIKPWLAWLYHFPVVPFTRFNNSIVMGSAIICFVAAIPLYFASKQAVKKYGNPCILRLRASRLGRYLTSSKLYGVYGRTYDANS